MYERVNWQNSPSTATPVSADNLNKMDKGIADIDSQLAHIAINVSGFPIQIPELDDTPRIQRAIDYASTHKYSEVLLENKTYIVSNTIYLKSNITLKGQKNTLIKISDTCTGFYSLFAINHVENVTINNIAYDGNYDRPDYDISIKPEIAVYCVDSNNIKILDNIFNTCGIWTISCEVSSEYPYNDNIYVERNQINYRVGKNTKTPDARGWSVDTTQMYIDAKNYWVKDNIIKTSYSHAQTSIEAHRRNGFVTNNIMRGFRNGVLIVPGEFEEDTEKTQLIVTENNISKCLVGVTLNQTIHRDIDGVIISDNVIKVDPNSFVNPSEAEGISLLNTLESNNNNKKIKNVSIVNNIITYKTFLDTYLDSDSITNFSAINMRGWVSLENVQIKDNQIINASGLGIIIGSKGNAINDNKGIGLSVENNIIINAGSNINMATETYNPRCGIRVQGSASSPLTKSVIKNNTIIDTRESGAYITKPIYSVQIDATCVIKDNNVFANGFNNLGVIRDYDVPLTWDSQVGTPIMTKSSKYYVDEQLAKISLFIEITDLSSFTQGYAGFITLPITPKENKMIPIIITGNNDTSSRMWFLELVSGSNSAYIRGILNDNTLSALTHRQTKVGMKISIIAEYLI